MSLPHSIDAERWKSMSLMEQMANIGSEVGRTRKWVEKGKKQQAEGAFLRCLDLIDATIKYGRAGLPSRGCLLEELCRARDLFSSSYLESDIPSFVYLDKYFGQFAAAVRK